MAVFQGLRQTGIQKNRTYITRKEKIILSRPENKISLEDFVETEWFQCHIEHPHQITENFLQFAIIMWIDKQSVLLYYKLDATRIWLTFLLRLEWHLWISIQIICMYFTAQYFSFSILYVVLNKHHFPRNINHLPLTTNPVKNV